MKHNLILTALGATLFAATPFAQGETLWLGGEGASDDNAGTSAEAPLATWNAAWTKIAAAADVSTLNVRPGVYVLTATPAQWSGGKRNMTVRGVDKSDSPASDASGVVLDGAGAYAIAKFGTAINLTVSGMTFRNGKGESATVGTLTTAKSGTSPYNVNQGFTLSNCVFEACLGGPAVVSLDAGGTIADCVFRRNANTVGATCILKRNATADGPCLVTDCTFTGNDGSGQTTETAGACLRSESAVLSLSNCTFDSNTNSARGVALTVCGGDVRATGCTFTGNRNEQSESSATAGFGGVFHVDGRNATTLTCDGCAFTDNSASGNGGVAAIRDAGAFLATNCTFRGNSSDTGAAVAGFGPTVTAESSASFRDCVLEGNSSPTGWIVGQLVGNANNLAVVTLVGCRVAGNVYAQGGVLLPTAGSTAERCAFTGNATVALGEGASVGSSSVGALTLAGGARVANCLVACNTNSLSAGAGIAVPIKSSGAATVLNCTVVGNRSAGLLAGIANGSDWNVRNCLFFGNRTIGNEDGKRLQEMGAFQYCICDGTKNSDSAFLGKAGNAIIDDPHFTDSAGGVYTLRRGSPCRNAGDTSYWTDAAAVDLAGKLRVNADDGSRVDVGCYEWYASNQGLMLLVR